jgi:hypothetical protein
MMLPNLLKYSNGWGHLIMSVSTQIAAVVLLLQHDPTLTGVATGLLLGVSGYWFISSSGNAQQQSTVSVSVPAPAITVASSTQPGGTNANA